MHNGSHCINMQWPLVVFGYDFACFERFLNSLPKDINICFYFVFCMKIGNFAKEIEYSELRLAFLLNNKSLQ